MSRKIFLPFLCLLILLTGCQKRDPQTEETLPHTSTSNNASTTTTTITAVTTKGSEIASSDAAQSSLVSSVETTTKTDASTHTNSNSTIAHKTTTHHTVSATTQSSLAPTKTSTAKTQSHTTKRSRTTSRGTMASSKPDTISKHSTQTTKQTTAESQASVFKATLRDSKTQNAIANIRVLVYDHENQLCGSATTNQAGIASMSIDSNGPFRILLENVPPQYTCKSEYLFKSTTVNILLDPAAYATLYDHTNAQYAVGKTMFDFELTDVNGNDYRLSQLLLNKKLIIIDFWYIDCVYCVNEFPYFEMVKQKYGEDILILAVNPYDSKDAIIDFAKKRNQKLATALTFPLLEDSCHLTSGFSVSGFPTTVFITPDGKIQNIHDSAFPSEEALLKTIDRYLSQ